MTTGTATQPKTGLVPWLTVMAITSTDTARAAIDKAVAALDGAIDIVHADKPSDVTDIQTEHPIAVYCLECDDDSDQAHRALGLIRGISAHTPVLLIDSGHAALDLESAVAEGASDLVPLNREKLLGTRVRQAVYTGRIRLELLEAGQRLNQSQRRLDVLLSHGQDARATLQELHITDPNPAFARLVGVADLDAARGLNMVDRVAPHDRDRVTQTLDQVARSNSDSSLVFDVITRQKHRRSVRALFTSGVSEAGDKPCINVVLQAVDNEHVPLADPSRHPALDGRMALHGVLAQATGRAKERVLGLAFIAIDDVTALQNEIGLAESDLLLQEVGLFLLQSMRGEDRVFRFGPGEYVILVERHSANELDDSTRQLHAALSDEIFGDEHRGATLSATVTYCVLSGDAGDNSSRLQGLMDKAYELREAGGNVCRECVDGAITQTNTEDREQWVARLKEAMAHDRFSLAYQGITSLAGDSQPYFDVLLRYVDDRGALVRPGEFLAAAEQADLMPAIDRWVTQRALDVIWQQTAKDAHISLFVKLSMATITAGDAFLSWIQQALEARPIARQNLIFSFREDDVRGRTRQARRLATEFEGLGFRIALTHYGSTPKAAQVLDKMPAHFIKLAPEFARQMLGGQEDERLAPIIASARERKIPLIAEQIEDANSMARLWQAGVNYVQGHFIQEPDTEALANTHELNV